ncbi:hypothetical protein BT93_L3520 [Corymbia citriodora subsp. variegata]|uniref:non-specific serine/threonine protein kinase n=1 Tax=Corymbia citriodora subsp. variegata TaxID=360336 RepID=A0A8T0CHC5_CORYI|nr:hypothetical protein BT93_L3520 [Corymbia citriodora subsp. variegata]
MQERSRNPILTKYGGRALVYKNTETKTKTPCPDHHHYIYIPSPSLSAFLRATSHDGAPASLFTSGGRAEYPSKMVTARKVGKYQLGRTIGEGTFAKVKFAQNLETGDSVAIKIMAKSTILEHRMVDQIRREISITKIVRHPNIVRLHEVLASRTKIYIILEFVTGGELFDQIVHKGRLPENLCRKYFQQLIDAVAHCHSKGVYHRDLKPENLLLDFHGNLKVSDFGLSALPQQGVGLLHTTCGTPNYVAPEVLGQQGYDGAAADIWSCGVILFVIMAGYLPFDEVDLPSLYKKVMLLP